MGSHHFSSVEEANYRPERFASAGALTGTFVVSESRDAATLMRVLVWVESASSVYALTACVALTRGRLCSHLDKHHRFKR
jgi:hypothetical protein